jgi:hypothetical protein
MADFSVLPLVCVRGHLNDEVSQRRVWTAFGETDGGTSEASQVQRQWVGKRGRYPLKRKQFYRDCATGPALRLSPVIGPMLRK